MKTPINTPHAPAPIGPYSQAILINDTLYTSGQIAINAHTDTLVLDNITLETKQVMTNIQAILKAADMDFNHVIKTTIFLHNMDDFYHVNEVYGSYFDAEMAPARETVQVSRLPKDVHVEISVVAVR